MPVAGRGAFEAGKGAVITSRSNARVKELRAALSGEARSPGDLLGLEGPNLIREGRMHGQRFETVYLREGSEAALRIDPRGAEAYPANDLVVLSRDVFDSAVSTHTPQGIAATWRIQDPKPELGTRRPGLILENIQDPGNLGTLIRSAAAFGIGDVAVTPETVNQWNPKVVRAAAGAHFQVAIRRYPLEVIVEQLRAQGVRLFAAVSDFLSGPGYGAPILAAPHGVLTGRVNNVEAAEPRNEGMPDDAERDATDGYPASLCYDTDFAQPCAIMVGNEGAGLSPEARRLADEQVSIPGTMESLNAAVAGSVLMYEAMRQIPLRAWARKRGLRP